MPATTIRYPQGTFGYTAGSPEGSGGLVESFETTGAIFKGAAVELDFTSPGRVKLATTTGATHLFLGVAADSSAGTGEVIGVVMLGHAICRVSTAVTAGDRLNRSGTVAGEMVTEAAATGVTTAAQLGTIKAVALETRGALPQGDLRCLVMRL
jgi:hypothetical protein